MQRLLATLMVVASFGAASALACAQQQGGHHWALVVHGGAGVIEKSAWAGGRQGLPGRAG